MPLSWSVCALTVTLIFLDFLSLKIRTDSEVFTVSSGKRPKDQKPHHLPDLSFYTPGFSQAKCSPIRTKYQILIDGFWSKWPPGKLAFGTTYRLDSVGCSSQYGLLSPLCPNVASSDSTIMVWPEAS